jgi:Transposase, Mutator family
VHDEQQSLDQGTGAAHGERSPDRINQRNGYRGRVWETPAGTVDLRIPKVRKGTPASREGARRGRAGGLRAWHLDPFSRRFGQGDGHDRHLQKQVSRLCGPFQAETFWTEFLRKLARRGLRGVKLVISDAHEGIKAAIAKVLHATWQRCLGSLKKSPTPDSVLVSDSRLAGGAICSGARSGINWSSSSPVLLGSSFRMSMCWHASTACSTYRGSGTKSPTAIASMMVGRGSIPKRVFD